MYQGGHLASLGTHSCKIKVGFVDYAADERVYPHCGALPWVPLASLRWVPLASWQNDFTSSVSHKQCSYNVSQHEMMPLCFCHGY
jgi:hypothetical protein